MSIRVQDPLFLLSAQTGLSVGELAAKAAAGNPDVEKPLEAFKTGEPIPLIFCRRRNSNGGVMVQPKTTEGSFSNPIIEEEFDDGSSTDIESHQTFQIKFLFVLSEGELPQLQVRDLFYGNSRRGTFNQAYDGRAGTWDPGNTNDDFDLVVQPNLDGSYSIAAVLSMTSGQSAKVGPRVYYEQSDGVLYSFPYVENSAPTFCGTSGSYSGLTTLSFEYAANYYQPEKVFKSINAFIRKGLQLTRLADGVTGPSDNFADLVKYLFQKNNRLADDLIDNTALTTAAKFADANGFLFNGQLKESQNLLDWLQTTSVNFLLRVSNSGGKFGLTPRLPYNTDHTIKTTQVTPEFTFTEEHVVDGGFEIEYISLEDREPVCFVVQWRQQPEADFGLVRTVQVRYENEAASGPFVDIDLSNYCTNEDHAVKVGAFRLAQRKFITHHLRLTVRERSYNAALVVGDLIRVRLRRETGEGDAEYHDKLYEINRIEKSFAGTIAYDLTHFPIDQLGRSIVARQVDAASGAGNTINVGRSAFNDDENSSTDSSSIGSASGGGGSNQPSVSDTEVEIDDPTQALIDDNGDPVLDNDGNQETIQDSSLPLGADVIADTGLLTDPLDESVDDTSAATITGSNTGYGGSSAVPGNTVEVQSTDLPCGDGRVCFYRLDKATGVRTLRECVTTPVSGKFSSSITTADISYAIIVEGQCPDPSSEDGYGPPIQLGETAVVVPDVTQYSYVRFNGTRTTYEQNSVGEWQQERYAMLTGFYAYDGTTQDPYVTIGSAYGFIGVSYRTLEPALTSPSGTLEWSPWVNYYNYQTNQHVGVNGVFSVPWRSHVFVRGADFLTGGGFGAMIGDIAGDGYGSLSQTPNPIPSNKAPLRAYNPGGVSPQPLREARIDGEWEFSNDGSTVLASWKGADDDGNPYTG